LAFERLGVVDERIAKWAAYNTLAITAYFHEPLRSRGIIDYSTSGRVVSALS
jgi:hypothetical protein